MNPSSGSRRPGAIINPTIAVNTASDMTRGFMSVTKSGKRTSKPGHEDNGHREAEIAAAAMINSSQRHRFVFARSMTSSARPFMTALTM